MSAASRSKERERGTDGWTDGQTDTERETKQKHVELSRGSLTARPSVSFFFPQNCRPLVLHQGEINHRKEETTGVCGKLSSDLVIMATGWTNISPRARGGSVRRLSSPRKNPEKSSEHGNDRLSFFVCLFLFFKGVSKWKDLV